MAWVEGRDAEVLYPLVLGLFVLLLLLLYHPLRVKIAYHYCNGTAKADLRMCVLGASFCLGLGEGRPGEKRILPGEVMDAHTFLLSWKKWKEYIMIALPHLRRLFSVSKIYFHYFKLEVGTGDAAETGIIVGLLWGGIGMLSPLLLPRVKFEPHIIPAYNRQLLDICFSGILEVRPVHIISVMVGLFISLLEKKNTLKGEGLSGGTSNPGFNANCHGKY